MSLPGIAYHVTGGVIDAGHVVYPVVYTFANPATSGNTELVAATVGKKIRVLSALVVATTAVNVKFQSATTDISAVFPLGANGGFVTPLNALGWFETAAGAALNVNLSANVAVGVSISYVIV